MGQKIRVMLCDDHTLLRAGLKALLNAEEDMEVVAEVGSGEEAVEQVAGIRPDVVLMDITLPKMNGLEATRQLLAQLPHCRVLILTMHKQVHYLLGALKAGASGYVLKSDVDRELVRAIRAVNGGEAFIYSADTRVFFQAYLERGGDFQGRQQLSHMEDQVLRLTALGHTAREIAEILNISPSTVDTYRGRIMDKLGLQTRAGLVQWAIQHGLLDRE